MLCPRRNSLDCEPQRGVRKAGLGINVEVFMLGATGKKTPVRSSLTSVADLGAKACGGKHTHIFGRRTDPGAV